jgi:peptidoglycan L-alanyl-D-glutamate endopeptidase CwlK
MNDPLSGLTADFVAKLQALLATCAARGAAMKPYFGLRDPVTQARLWRQSRSSAQIAAAKSTLVSKGAPFLALCLDEAGTSRGPWATNALPGYSWHQFGEACDCVWVNSGVEDWDGAGTGYAVYAEEAAKLGMRTLGSIGDYGHVQLDPHDSPLAAYDLAKIDAIMKAKFGDA